MSSISTTNDPGRTVRAEPKGFVNNGKLSTIPGGISANRIRLQIKLVDKMLAAKEKEHQLLEWEEKETPAEDRSPISTAKIRMAFAEICRLQQARRYWDKRFNEELQRLKNGGAQEPNLPQTDPPAVPLGPVTAGDLGLRVPEAPMPDSGPGGKVCNPKADQWDIDHAWEDYWREVGRAQSDFRLDYSHWLVDKVAFDERRRRTLMKARPFTEKEPAQPTIRVVPEPQCPKPRPDPDPGTTL